MLFGVDRCATQVVSGCGTGASEKNTHPAEVALYLRNPPSPQSQGWVSSLSGSAVAKKTPIPANGLLILLPTLTFGGGRGISWAWSGIYGWVFFSLAPVSDLGFTLFFATLPLIFGGGRGGVVSVSVSVLRVGVLNVSVLSVSVLSVSVQV